MQSYKFEKLILIFHFDMRYLLLALACLLSAEVWASDTLKVYFLHGSKPARKYKQTEEKWFGGRKGGHVGVEVCAHGIINFVPSGSFHYVGKRKNRHSAFRTDSQESFLEIFGGKAEDATYTIVSIPIDAQKATSLCEVQTKYLTETPYDYAFLGMRCGAASYDMLSKVNIVKPKSRFCTMFKIFYPKLLRKKLLRKAKKNHWQVSKQIGTKHRKWER